MIGIYFVIGLIALFLIYNFVKILLDPDVKEASNLMMSIKHYRIYKEIYDEQIEYHKKGIMPPDRTNKIPNMNEWRRYGEYRLQKQKEDLYNSFKS